MPLTNGLCHITSVFFFVWISVRACVMQFWSTRVTNADLLLYSILRNIQNMPMLCWIRSAVYSGVNIKIRVSKGAGYDVRRKDTDRSRFSLNMRRLTPQKSPEIELTPSWRQNKEVSVKINLVSLPNVWEAFVWQAIRVCRRTKDCVQNAVDQWFSNVCVVEPPLRPPTPK